MGPTHTEKIENENEQGNVGKRILERTFELLERKIMVHLIFTIILTVIAALVSFAAVGYVLIFLLPRLNFLQRMVALIGWTIFVALFIF